MKISHLLVFDTVDHTSNTSQLNLGDLQARYGAVIQGTNTYWGLQGPNLNLPAGQGLQPGAKQFLVDFVAAIPAGGAGTVDLGLEPNSSLQGAAAFADVDARLPLIGYLGNDLGAQQDAAEAAGKTLRIIVRFASEMNLGTGNPWQGVPEDFKRSWGNVRTALKNANPRLLMNFAPGISANVTVTGKSTKAIQSYWPGPGLVNVIGCTWYAGSGAAIPQAKSKLDAYFKMLASEKLPHAVSELGASCTKTLTEDDTLPVQTMYWHLVNLASNQTIDHVTFFLEQPWSGVGVNLATVQALPTQSNPCP